MSSSGVALPAPAEPPQRFLQVGRTFLHPALDYLLIGGGLSLSVGLLLPSTNELYSESAMLQALPWCILAFNSAHFAASTVRLYSKPGAFEELPTYTLLLPIVAVVVLTLAVEGGWAGGFDPTTSPPGTYDVSNGSPFGSFSLRLTL